MKNIKYKTCGTCSKEINITLDDDNIIRDLNFVRGCDGNLKGVSSLCLNMDAKSVINKLEGITCGRKNTSCPDQLAKALKEIV